MADFSAICTLWRGDFVEGASRSGYSPIYVSRLKDMIARHTKKEMDFVCFTNWPKREFRDDIRVIPLQTNWPAWWSKIEMFRPGLDLENRVLALDIDMLIVGDLDSIIDYHATMGITDYWSYSRFMDARQAVDRAWRKRGRHLIPMYSSDVIVYDRGVCIALYTDFRPEYMETFCGDQDWIAQCLGSDIPRFPQSWARKMNRADRGSHPLSIGEARVLACHPVKNHELRSKRYTFAANLWEGLI